MFKTYGIIKSETELRNLLSLLNNAQRNHLDVMVKKATHQWWKDTLARLKDGVEDNIDLSERSINGWRLHFIEDRGAVVGVCECGQRIRYEYHLENVQTGKRLVLGSTCIESILGISSRAAKEIAFTSVGITSDRDEILIKIRDGWAMDEKVLTAVNDGTIEVMPEAQELLNLGLPILQSMETRLLLRITYCPIEPSKSSTGGVKRNKLF